jgi:voltage-gated potassium channel
VGYSSIQSRTHRSLDGDGSPGLSRTQRVSAAAILLSVALAIAATEVTVREALGPWLIVIEASFGAFFCVEFATRVWAAGAQPNYTGFRGRLRYLVTPFALIDLIGILPFVVGLGSQSFLVRMVRLFRLIALSRLARYSTAMRLVTRSVYARRYELLLAIAMAGCVVLIAAGALYSVEGESQSEQFGSIPRALWWSISALTTVGYGDVVPITPAGKFFAALTSIAGIGLIAMPTGILAAAFSDAFAAARRQDKESPCDSPDA